MDFKKMADTASDLAAENADKIEDAAEALKDKIVDAVPDSMKDKAAKTATSLIGRAADALAPKK